MSEKSTISYNIDFLRERAESLAQSQSWTDEKKPYQPVGKRLDEAKKILTEAYRVLSHAAKSNQDISPAAEWLIDNFYVIQEQIVQVANDFPKEYQKSIPKLDDGRHKGLPRVYELALNVVLYTDYMVDMQTLVDFAKGFQEQQVLTQGEIWAIPIMIRLVLIEQLAEKSRRVLERKKIRPLVSEFVKELANLQNNAEPGQVLRKMTNWVSNTPVETDADVLLVEMVNAMQSADLLMEQEKRWFDFRFEQAGLTLDEALRREAREQSRLQVSIQHIVVSLREVSQSDWSDFVEECSIMHQVLRLDPAGYYSGMDFQTRDRYRKVVERLSRHSHFGESEVTEKVLELAESGSEAAVPESVQTFTDGPSSTRHVGFYLLGEGYDRLSRAVGYSMPSSEKLRRLFERRSGLYIVSIAIHTVLLMAILWLVAGGPGLPETLSIALLTVALFPALDLSVSSVNRLFTMFFPPRILPKMDYEDGVPDSSRSVVVVPTMITSPEDVKTQLEALEVRALANPDRGLQFGLLTDFTDAQAEETQSDKAILEACNKELDRLNKKYSSSFGDKFFLFHRQRRWNEAEGVWMGWERKRGKLEEFNRLLMDPDTGTSYVYFKGDLLKTLKECPVRFVITLDADTRMPPDSAKELVCTAAHPLNRAAYNTRLKRIDKGYGIIQPRISISPDLTRKTWFSRIFSGNVGLDPYSTAVSDIYQDLKGEAIFTGKGIFDVKAFHAVMDGRLPENRILSHDLLESTYMRTGLATDIELFDDYPATYAGYSKRNHRWTRGDWQIASWLFWSVPEIDGKVKNPVNLLSKWKIFDNLRRSLNPFFLTLFFVSGWFWLPGSPLLWTAAAFGILAFPIYVSLSADIVNRPARVRWRLYMEKVRANLRMNSLQAFSVLVFLPHQMAVQLDAVVRTLWRLCVSKKNLLEWTSASHTENASSNSVFFNVKMVWISPVLGVSVLAAALYLTPPHWQITLPFAFLWLGAPAYSWYLSRPVQKRKDPFTEEDRLSMRMYARRTWFYFERFASEEHSWLPPDNYQEEPPLPLAARTSPTNIGLYLVSVKVAYTMGFIPYGVLLERVEQTLRSLQMLETYKGHFYNWYETLVGEVLSPKYVSTVDSGNLAASLMVIKEAVRESVRGRGINRSAWQGLEDTVRTVQAIFTGQRERRILPEEADYRIRHFTGSLLDELQNDQPKTIMATVEKLRQLKQDALELVATDLLPMRNEVGDERLKDLLYWIERPLIQIDALIDEWKLLSGAGDLETGSCTLGEIVRSAAEAEGGGKTVAAIARWKRQAKDIISTCEQLVQNMDFSFLYNKKRGLFHIGFNAERAQLDLSTYDLLASEARIASYIAIAKGDVPSEHWFRLSRRLTRLGNNEILLSWGGTMFEYLMPMLFMRSYPNTLLSHTYDRVVRWQQQYGVKRGYPWGASESAYYFLNQEMHYQYRAFGTPGLGLKRGLAEEYVVAPYASLLALMVDPRSSMENLQSIEHQGGLGLMGFYDAIDYTPSRLNVEESHKLVKTYMAHHHGMGLIALENVLNGWSVHHWFHSDPLIKGCDLLLQEKVPRGVPIKEPHPIDVELEPGEQEKIEYIVEHAGVNDLDRSPPRLHLLSNGNYSAFVTHAGTGLSKYQDIALTNWKPDVTTDPSGLFFYIKDKESGEYWSAGHQPVKRKPDRYDTWFHNGKVVTSRVDEWIETTTEMCVSSEHAMELRRISLTNYADRPRVVEVTSYAEVVLNRLADHNSHPAFSKLFVQTDYLEEHHAVLAKRRPRGQDENEQWFVHTVTGHDPENLSEPLQFETERSAFIGRGRSLSRPLAMDSGQSLTGSAGNVSDPIVSLRMTVRLNPGDKVQLVFGTGWADSREAAVRLADIGDNQHAADREFELASVYSLVELEHIGVSAKNAHYFQKIASWLLYPQANLRAPSQKLMQNRRHQSGLWAYGISGDLPLLVYRIRKSDQIKHVKTVLQAQVFWTLKGLDVDLVILNDHPPSYADELQESIQQAIEASMKGRPDRQRGGVYVLKSDNVTEEDLTLILTVAVAVIQGELPKNAVRSNPEETASFYLKDEPARYRRMPLTGKPAKEITDSRQKLKFFNGYGGFSDDGNEYHILLGQSPDTGDLLLPPAPWINVISNPDMGFIATERGAGYTWSLNSRENKLTGWSNDPVCDPGSEVFYIRDEESGEFWSPLPAPCPGDGAYRTVHGFGYSSYQHTSGELEQELVQFMPAVDPVKVSILSLKNRTPDKRRLSLFTFTDWVMGVEKYPASRFIIPEISGGRHLLLASNHYNNEFAGRVTFNSLVVPGREVQTHFTTDRTRFIGRNRTLSQPASLLFEEELDNQLAIGGDSCAAFQTVVELDPGESLTLVSLLGETTSRIEAERLAGIYSDPENIARELHDVKSAWKEKLSAVVIETPDDSLDVMMNGWLMYQNISCRLWARTAFYQAGGAYGFRDQLQDVMAALYVDPQITRDQILLHASRQFEQGDVQHWWHPPTGRGIRSKISDDRLWLPYVTDFYERSTGDESILEEKVPYIATRQLRDDEDEVYLQPDLLDREGTLYEHCCKAIDISLKFGEHGIPLIGAGDWNDGMNRVGEKGKGESVWLGFFIYDILNNFTRICKKMDDAPRAERYRDIARQLKKDLNHHGWDGEWYLRAFYDDGSPLGSSENDECRIDAISQAWSVLSKVATKKRGQAALRAVEKHLISREDRIIRLLTPAFDRTEKDPGYIRGYIPGVRENGGQYTHGALWTVKAFAEAGMGDKAVRYLHMINPVNHTRDREEVGVYKSEPYVVAADVYGEEPLTSRGGWTWYTGSAGWMYKVALESVLGIRFNGDRLIVRPSVSSSWKGYTVRLKTAGETRYEVTLENPHGLERGSLAGTVDGNEVKFAKGVAAIPLKNDNRKHEVRLVIKPF